MIFLTLTFYRYLFCSVSPHILLFGFFNIFLITQTHSAAQQQMHTHAHIQPKPLHPQVHLGYSYSMLFVQQTPTLCHCVTVLHVKPSGCRTLACYVNAHSGAALCRLHLAQCKQPKPAQRGVVLTPIFQDLCAKGANIGFLTDMLLNIAEKL